jgi:hypothetical protein
MALRLISQGREDQAKIKEDMNNLLESLTYEKMVGR